MDTPQLVHTALPEVTRLLAATRPAAIPRARAGLAALAIPTVTSQRSQSPAGSSLESHWPHSSVWSAALSGRQRLTRHRRRHQRPLRRAPLRRPHLRRQRERHRRQRQLPRRPRRHQRQQRRPRHRRHRRQRSHLPLTRARLQHQRRPDPRSVRRSPRAQSGVRESLQQGSDRHNRD